MTVSQIQGIKSLVLKEDYQNLKTILESENFVINKATLNYNDGNDFHFCEISASRSLAKFPSKHTVLLDDGPYNCEETLKISFVDKGEFFKELEISRSFTDYLTSYYSILTNWLGMDWQNVSNLLEHIEGEENNNGTIPATTVKSFFDAKNRDNLSCIYKNGFDQRRYFLNKGKLPDQFWFVPPNYYQYSVVLTEWIAKKQTGKLVGTFKIPLVKSGKVFLVTVQIGGVRKKYIVDTGASEVAVDEETVLNLFQNGEISNKDFLPSKNYSLANGSIKTYKRIMLPALKIGDVEVKNIEAYIVKKGEPLLLGKSFLDVFKSWKIDNLKNELILTNE